MRAGIDEAAEAAAPIAQAALVVVDRDDADERPDEQRGDDDEREDEERADELFHVTVRCGPELPVESAARRGRSRDGGGGPKPAWPPARLRRGRPRRDERAGVEPACAKGATRSAGPSPAMPADCCSTPPRPILGHRGGERHRGLARRHPFGGALQLEQQGPTPGFPAITTGDATADAESQPGGDCRFRTDPALIPPARQAAGTPPMNHSTGDRVSLDMAILSDASDEPLSAQVALAVRGDEAAFTRIVRAHHDDMTRVCFVVCGDPDLADEAVQAAWAIVWRKLSTLRDPDRLRPWLVSVAANEARRLVKRSSRRSVVEIGLDTAEATFGGDPGHRAVDLDLVNALARLSPDDRTLLALRYVAGFDSTELSRATGRSASGTRARLARLLARLRRELSDD